MSVMTKRLLFVPLLWLAACATAPPSLPTPERAATPSDPGPAALLRYVDTLARMAPGDTDRQLAEIAAARAAAQQTRRSSDMLRYALAIGSAGHPSSNPVEAKRLITDLLAGPNELAPAEVDFASALLREFDARVALYAELARVREDVERRLVSSDTDADARAASLAVENKALRRALAEAERKLEAVADMERSLLEQSSSRSDGTQP